MSGLAVCEILCCNDDIAEKKSSFLVTFSNGELKRKGSAEIKFHCYENSKTSDDISPKKIEKYLVVTTERLQYSGCNFGTTESGRLNLCRYYIGVANKKTQKISVYGTQLIQCSPVLETFVPVESFKSGKESLSFINKNDGLTSRFGSKAMKKALLTREQYAVSDSNLSTMMSNLFDQCSLKVDDERTLKTEKAGKSIQIAQVIPPQNHSATQAKDVYSLNDIISTEEYNALDDLARTFKEITPVTVEKWKNDELYSLFVLHHLEDAPEKLTTHRAKLLVYCNFMFLLLKFLCQDFCQKDPLPLVPQPFKGKLLDRFAESVVNPRGMVTRSISRKMKDRVMAYAMVLSLFVDNWSLDMSLFMKDFSRGLVFRASKIAYALGCHVSSKRKGGSSLKLIELKLPLYVPSNKDFARRKLA